MARDLEADLKLCEAATEGPWGEIYHDRRVTEHPHWGVDCDLPCSLTVAIMGAGYGHDGEAEANAKFIAAARTGWTETIRELMEARKQIGEMETVIERYRISMMRARKTVEELEDVLDG